MIHQQFISDIIQEIKTDDSVVGLAVGGSWITNEIDAYSDLDLVLVTHQKITDDVGKMLDFAKKFGNLLNGFTGEHVGEKRLLICLYENPLLHVDIKFLTADEFFFRVENPVVVWERENILSEIINKSDFQFPYPNYQWIEERFWIWIHYVSAKIGRGELFEALDFTSFLRSNVIASLLQIKNNNLPKSLRKAEFLLDKKDIEILKSTVASYDKKSIIESVENIILSYQNLRKLLFTNEITLQTQTEKRSLEYFEQIKNQ